MTILASRPPPSRNQRFRESTLRQLVASAKISIADHQKDSNFLQSPAFPCAVFARHEIQINRIPIGRGTFSAIHEIIGLSLDDAITERCDAQQRELRRRMKDRLFDENGRPRFVLKHLLRKLLLNSKKYQSALRDLALEVEYMSRLSHEYILPLLGRPIDGIEASHISYDAFFLVTERLDMTLTQAIENWEISENPPSIEARIPYLEQLGNALEHLHQRRIVFRDLKPDNVGISTEGRIKLFDFGLCRELPNDDSSTTDDLYEMSGVGTQRYMACEVLEGAAYNCKADVYSWGLLSWEIMACTLPYVQYKDHRKAVIIHNERPPLPPQWPAYLQSVLSNSWCRGIHERYNMSEVLAVLDSRHSILARRVPVFGMKNTFLHSAQIACS